jgi:hypothetical protein
VTVLVFFITNVVLNFSDVVTDGMTASALGRKTCIYFS